MLSETDNVHFRAQALIDVMSEKQLKVISLDEVAQHNKPGDAWIAVNGYVYNVGVFARIHPGGTGVLLRFVTCVGRAHPQDTPAKNALRSLINIMATWSCKSTTKSLWLASWSPSPRARWANLSSLLLVNLCLSLTQFLASWYLLVIPPGIK